MKYLQNVIVVRDVTICDFCLTQLPLSLFFCKIMNSALYMCVCGPCHGSDISRRTLVAEALVRTRVSPCEICGGQSGT
jgi:hypothetical protein